MGDRVSVQFKNGEDTSVVLFNHWGGMGFVEEVKKWVKNFEMHVIANWKHKNHSTPITRCDVENLMVQFIMLRQNLILLSITLLVGLQQLWH